MVVLECINYKIFVTSTDCEEFHGLSVNVDGYERQTDRLITKLLLNPESIVLHTLFFVHRIRRFLIN